MHEIRFIDLFSGIGGFRQGLELSGGYRCVWSNDWNKYANQVYTSRFGEENHHPGDIRKVRGSSIPDHDLLCAGFPCQAFSIAGKRRGFRDTHGTLFFEIARIARAKKPTLLLLENVKGLLSHDEGLTFQVILESLEELGYLVEWQVLNSKHYGVPQNRERVFIIGHLRGRSTQPVFPITEIHQDSAKGIEPESWGQIGATLSGRSAGGQNARGNYVIILDYLNRSIREDETFNTLKTNQGSPSSAPTIVSNAVDTSGYLRQMGRHEIGLHGLTDYRIRCLTPVECERLQGFPDGWTEGISDTQRYKCLGNAVTVNVIKFLGDRIRESIKSKSKRMLHE